MRISELMEATDSSLPIELSAAATSIASQVVDSGAKSPMDLNAFLKLLNNKVGVQFDPDEFKQIWRKTPLKNTISDIVGGKVIFRGQRIEPETSSKIDSTTNTVEKMAKRATSKRT